jgi:hypothetical protein
MSPSVRFVTLALLLALPVSAQDAKKKKADPRSEFDRSVDTAVRKGVDFLRRAADGKVDLGGPVEKEILLFALVHAGRDVVPDEDPLLQQYLKQALECPLSTTYRVALIAMSLEELQRVKYQGRIWQCAQFLVDNQNRDGGWGYGTPTPFDSGVPTKSAKKKVATGGAPKEKPSKASLSGPRPKPDVVSELPVSKKRDGAEASDNSNSQYAALGLRACRDSGILIPEPVAQRAHQFWIDRSCGPDPSKGVATGGSEPVSWGYKERTNEACGGMTAGAAGALCIYDYLLDPNHSWSKDPMVTGGLAWLAANFRADRNPGNCQNDGREGEHQRYYYLYALERLGKLYGTEAIGTHQWYPEGAQEILKRQRGDGAWQSDNPAQNPGLVQNTCFAILFLRRATASLDVASEDRFLKGTPGNDK